MNEKLTALQVYISENDLDGFLITKEENVSYITGFEGSFGMVFISKEKVILITDGRYKTKAQEVCRENDIRFFLYDKDFKTDFAESISGKVGVELSMTLGNFNQMKEWFGDIDFLPQKQVIETIRREKTSQELEYIKAAQRHVDDVLVPFLRTRLVMGISEARIAFDLEVALRDKGKYGLSFDPIVAFGENTALPHHTPSDRELKKGDPILVDCGVRYKGYCSDMTRMFHFGEPSQEFEEKYKLLLEAQRRTIELLEPEKNIQEVAHFCRGILGEESKHFTHSLGHGVGREVHELPGLSIRAEKTEVLKPGDVITIEPGIYYPGKFGMRIEDLLFVSDNEVLMISKTPKSLLVFKD